MGELIVIKNKPAFRDMLSSRQYTKVTNVGTEIVLQNTNGHKAICTFEEEGLLEYIHQYLNFDPVLFAEMLRVRYGTFWIDQDDLLDYNRFAFSEEADFSEFHSRLEMLLKEQKDVKVKNRTESEYLWRRLNSRQRAKIIPKGYLKNYLLSRPASRQQELDLLELFEDAQRDRLSFGMYLWK
jgi:hypothetical protein